MDNAQSRAWNKAHTTPAARRKERKAHTATIQCVICGKGFVQNSVAITCSPACSAELHRRNCAAWEAAHRPERNAYQLERYHRRKDDKKD